MNAMPFNGGRSADNGKEAGGFSAMHGSNPRVSPGGSMLDLPAIATDRADEQLLSDYRHGDKTAFTAIVARYQRELYHFLVRFLGNC